LLFSLFKLRLQNAKPGAWHFLLIASGFSAYPLFCLYWGRDLGYVWSSRFMTFGLCQQIKLGALLLAAVVMLGGAPNTWAQQGPLAAQAMQAYQAGQLQRATALFEQVVTQNPTYTDAWYNLGSLQYRQNNFDKARAAFERVVTLNPSDSQARYNLALALEKLNRPLDATTVLGQIPASSPAYAKAQRKLSALRPKTQTVAQQAPKQLTQPSQATSSASASRQAAAFVQNLSGPTGLALGPQGEVYIANYSQNSIVKVAPDGSKSTYLTGKGLHGPIGLVRDPRTGDLYVANYLKDNILRVGTNGQTSIVVQDLQKPYNLMLDSLSNMLYVSEQGTNQVSRIQL
jgi:hypothetical protein